MNRRDAVLALLAIGVVPSAAEARQPGTPARIGYLTATNPESAKLFLVPFSQGMRELGYVEGKDFVMEVRYAQGKIERLPELAAELVRLRLDVVAAAFPSAIRALQNATTTMPIVIFSQGDPVLAGFARSLSQPGGNITGVARLIPALNSKLIEMLVSIVPNLARVAALDEPVNYGSPAQAATVRRDFQAAALSRAVAVEFMNISTLQDAENAFKMMVQRNIGAAVLNLGAVMFPARHRIAELSAINRVPSAASLSEYSAAGGMMSYGTNSPDHYRRVAAYVDKILKGAKPGDLPIEQATTFELVINLKTAKALGITIPQAMLLRADRVIE